MQKYLLSVKVVIPNNWDPKKIYFAHRKKASQVKGSPTTSSRAALALEEEKATHTQCERIFFFSRGITILYYYNGGRRCRSRSRRHCLEQPRGEKEDLLRQPLV